MAKSASTQPGPFSCDQVTCTSYPKRLPSSHSISGSTRAVRSIAPEALRPCPGDPRAARRPAPRGTPARSGSPALRARRVSACRANVRSKQDRRYSTTRRSRKPAFDREGPRHGGSHRSDSGSSRCHYGPASRGFPRRKSCDAYDGACGRTRSQRRARSPRDLRRITRSRNVSMATFACASVQFDRSMKSTQQWQTPHVADEHDATGCNRFQRP